MSVFEFIKEDLLGERVARELITPFRSELVLVWERAWEHWHGFSEDVRRRLTESPLHRPIILNGLAQSFAREQFSGRERDGLVVCDAIPGVFTLYIHERLLLRFNGLDRDHVVRLDGATRLKKDFFGQVRIYGLNNDATRFAVGFTLDPSKTEMEHVEMSLQYGNTPIYHIELDDEAGAVEPLPSPKVGPFPILPSEAIRTKNPR